MSADSKSIGEKTVTPGITMNANSSDIQLGEQMVKDWSDEDEKRTLRKLDFLLMPLLLAGFFALQLDRSNISNALTSTITTDLGITKGDVSSGNQLQLAALIIFEIPSNIFLQKVGSSVWITGQCFLWGLVAVFQAFITDKSSFYATRWLLGMFEAGYIPGCQLMMSMFYKRDELAIRTAIFYVGNYFSAGTGSLIAAGILQMAGTNGLGGWQWLFIIDGLITIFMAVVFFFLLPATPLKTLPLCRFKSLDIFSDRDRHIMHNRVILDDPLKEDSGHAFKLKEILAALCNYKLLCHMAINFLALAPKGGLQLYTPTIIKSFGFDTTKANALSSVSNYGVIVLSLAASWISDRTAQRGIWCIAASAYSMIFAGVLYGLSVNADHWTKYAILTLLNSGNAVAQSLNDAWISSNSQTPRQRSIGLALGVIGSNTGGLAGQQLFTSSDAPRYANAFLGVLCLYAASIVAIAVQMGLYFWNNKKLDKKQQETDGTEAGGDTVVESWRYEL